MTGRLRVLVGCEYSGIVRDAFTALGHDAMSCDLLPTESPGPHYRGDVFDVIDDGWDVGIFHPPCTYLTKAANGSLWSDAPSRPDALKGPARWAALIEAAVFFRRLWECDIPRVAIENPLMNRHGQAIIGRRATQTIQPWMFGHTETKAICLWLRGLPPLLSGEDVQAAMMQLPPAERERVHRMAPSKDRAKMRSRFYGGVAEQMALQWAGDVREVAA